MPLGGKKEWEGRMEGGGRGRRGGGKGKKEGEGG